MYAHSISINNVHMRSVCMCRETANVSKFGLRLGTGSTCMESPFITLLLPYNMYTKEGVHTFVRITQPCSRVTSKETCLPHTHLHDYI